jgi:hypothetical protein
MLFLIERAMQENPLEFGHLSDVMKKAASLKYRDLIKECIAENMRGS